MLAAALRSEKETRSNAAANRDAVKKGSNIASKIVDNRPKAIAQRQLQGTIQNSPRVRQLKAYRAIMAPKARPIQPLQFQFKAGTAHSEAVQAEESQAVEPVQENFLSVVQRTLNPSDGSDGKPSIAVAVVEDINNMKKGEAPKIYSFEEGDTVDNLRTDLKAVAVKMYALKQYIECRMLAPLIKGGNYAIQKTTEFEVEKAGTSTEKLKADAAITIADIFSTMMRELLRHEDSTVEEVQAMLVGKSILVSANYSKDYDKLAAYVGVNAVLAKNNPKDLVTKCIGVYKRDFIDAPVQKKKRLEYELKSNQLGQLSNFFANTKAEERVQYVKSAGDLMDIESPLVIISGEGDYSEKKSKGQEYQPLHVEQNLLLALINYLLVSDKWKDQMKGLVIGGYKSACGTCEAVLDILKIAIEQYTGQQVKYGKGMIPSHFGEGRSKFLIVKQQVGQLLEEVLKANSKDSDGKERVKRMQEVLAKAQAISNPDEKSASFSADIDTAKEKVELTPEAVGDWIKKNIKTLKKDPSKEEISNIITITKLMPGHSINEACLQVLKMAAEDYKPDKSSKEFEKSPSYEQYNCLITALNLGQPASLDNVITIRDLVLATTNTPIGAPLIDDEQILQIIIGKLGIRSREYRIDSGGKHTYVRAGSRSAVTMRGTKPPAQGTTVEIIRHTSGLIGHFRHMGQETL